MLECGPYTADRFHKNKVSKKKTDIRNVLYRADKIKCTNAAISLGFCI